VISVERWVLLVNVTISNVTHELKELKPVEVDIGYVVSNHKLVVSNELKDWNDISLDLLRNLLFITTHIAGHCDC
jgi:ABC-type transporter Mla maintaining outer membrane lipid asymmetry ATPase subunit MlaF